MLHPSELECSIPQSRAHPFWPEPISPPCRCLSVFWLPTISARAEMTFPRVVKDLLMFAPSWLEEEKPRCSGPISEPH